MRFRMDYYEAKDFVKTMHPGKEVKFEFDEKCHRIHEINYVNGSPGIFHHVENNKVKVTVDGQDPFYIPIIPHREAYSWAAIKDMINSKKDVFLNDQYFQNYERVTPEEMPIFKKELCEATGLEWKDIEIKIADYKTRQGK